MKKQKGITLVSLVVTIIVLIILAGVTINAILGENGIITIAKQAKENMELAQEKEQTELNELYVQIIAEGKTASGGSSYDAIAKLTEFKKKIAEAITNKGIETNETDTAETMADNIGKLYSTQATGNATVEQVLEGATFSNETDTGLTGTMPNRGELNWNPSENTTFSIPAGYYTGGTLSSANAYTQAKAKAFTNANRVYSQIGSGSDYNVSTYSYIAPAGYYFAVIGGYGNSGALNISNTSTASLGKSFRTDNNTGCGWVGFFTSTGNQTISFSINAYKGHTTTVQIIALP